MKEKFEFIRWEKPLDLNGGSCFVLRNEKIYLIKLVHDLVHSFIINAMFDVTDLSYSYDEEELFSEEIYDEDSIELGYLIHKYL
jgi:hypothetical protein